MSVAFPGESAEYRAARDRLLGQEIELRRLTEAVAASRRELPPGGVVPEDYVFQRPGADGTPTDVRLSELFAAQSSSTHLPTPDRIPATSAPSSQSGTCSTSPRRAPDRLG
jgi:predicted dithiol-disulfide oxidoreductase (DUF899 family)